jgi:prepilin-type N-terminal cleavage/methylation domain-containing protein
MLKINKILSKKIKYPMSLLGLFPFCHSRESGNPSSLSLRGAKQRSNLKGFSLIELMVAVVILSIALIGIFLAFSSGWMGMANARDRTVATNYAREEMEDIKNMDFELITNVNLGVAEIIEGKFNRVVTVIDEHNNLKKITTRVFWNDKAGKPKNVETNMLISRTQLNPRDADNIILYADPYYTVLPSSGNANIIAVIKDIKGNTKINWDGGDIHFVILGSGYSDEPKNGIGSNLGYLGPGADEIYVTPNEGRAEITFTATPIGGVMVEGDVIIEASVELPDGSTISNTVEITVTLDVTMVKLTADLLTMKADGISTSDITAELLNSGLQLVTNASNNITFNISGEGTFVDYSDESPLPNTITIAPSGGKAYIKVKSINDTAGVAIVTATSEGLLSDTVNIITTGNAQSISVSVDPNLIYEGDTEGAIVTVEIQDINGNPVEYSGDISLETSNGTGFFDQNSLNFDNSYSASTTFSSTSTGIVIITASGGGLEEGNTTIEVRAVLVADNIALTAVPQNIPVGGGISEASTIKAIIREDLTIVSIYSNNITFEIISDTSGSAEFSDYSTSIILTGSDYGNDGEATVQLLPSASNVGTVTIKVSTTNSEFILIEETVEVAFYSDAHHIILSANPPKMEVLGGVPDNCIITATIVDEYGTEVKNYNELITFTFLEGYPLSAKFLSAGTSSLTKRVEDGVAYVDLISQYNTGTAKIEAISLDISGSLNIPVGISLTLEGDPIYDSENKSVSFNINIVGAVLLLEEMQVSWDSPSGETLNIIEINPNSTGNPVIYPDTSTPIPSGVPINIEDITLSEGTSNVKMYFSTDMSGKTFEVIFNPYSGNYLITITEPIP